MLKYLMINNSKVFLLIGCVLGLVFIRIFEDQLFYDPFLQFFKKDFKNRVLPDFDGIKLFFGLFFRYSFNTIFSLAIIYFLFRQLDLVKFAFILYIMLFTVLLFAFFGILYYSKKPDFFLLFYIRRFLIQPIFLMLFIPAFYYQQLKK